MEELHEGGVQNDWEIHEQTERHFKERTDHELKTDREVVQVFKRRVIRTFIITEKDNENLSNNRNKGKEWLEKNLNKFKSINKIRIRDTPHIITVTDSLVKDILSSFKEK